jgi:hypothetical protein
MSHPSIKGDRNKLYIIYRPNQIISPYLQASFVIK